MRILLKSALKEAQLFGRVTKEGYCPPLEVYVSRESLIDSFPKDLDRTANLLGRPEFPYTKLEDFLRIFHLPVSSAWTFDGLALNSQSVKRLEPMIQALKSQGYEEIPLLCHLENRAEVWQEMGLWPQMCEVWEELKEQGVRFFIEHSQIMTEAPGDNRVFPTWDLAPLEYREALAKQSIGVTPVYDLCHMMNSARFLHHVGFLPVSVDDFIFDRLGRYLDQGLGHIHLAAGRSVRQGTDSHATGFDTLGEKALLEAFFCALDAAEYQGDIVLETNEVDPTDPTRMLKLWKELQSLP